MSSAGAFLARLVDALNAAGIPFMVAGSFASTYHGVPRTTHDIDVVVDPNFRSLRAFLGTLDADAYYVDVATAEGALRTRGQFNVIDLETGWKVDLIIRKARDFSVEEFARRESAEMLGVSVFVASAEDTILSKLEWGAASGSERQMRDVAGVLEVAGRGLDLAYIGRWARALGVEARWEEARRATDGSPPA